MSKTFVFFLKGRHFLFSIYTSTLPTGNKNNKYSRRNRCIRFGDQKIEIIKEVTFRNVIEIERAVISS